MAGNFAGGFFGEAEPSLFNETGKQTEAQKAADRARELQMQSSRAAVYAAQQAARAQPRASPADLARQREEQKRQEEEEERRKLEKKKQKAKELKSRKKLETTVGVFGADMMAAKKLREEEHAQRALEAVARQQLRRAQVAREQAARDARVSELAPPKIVVNDAEGSGSGWSSRPVTSVHVRRPEPEAELPPPPPPTIAAPAPTHAPRQQGALAPAPNNTSHTPAFQHMKMNDAAAAKMRAAFFNVEDDDDDRETIRTQVAVAKQRQSAANPVMLADLSPSRRGRSRSRSRSPGGGGGGSMGFPSTIQHLMNSRGSVDLAGPGSGDIPYFCRRFAKGFCKYGAKCWMKHEQS